MDDKTIVCCVRECVRQTRFNALVAIILGGFAYLTYEQTKQIKQLNRELAELKRVERN